MTSKLKLYKNNVVNSNKYPLKNDNDKGIQNINGTKSFIPDRTGVFVITFDTSINKYKVLMARKCKDGERTEVGHKTRNGGTARGAAATKQKYWNKWVSIGGTNYGKARSYDAAISEFNDETASNEGHGANYLTFLHQGISSDTYIYIAYYPYQNSDTLIDKSSKDLIFSSHGEIAQLKWHVIGDKLHNVADYVETSYTNILLPYIKNLDTQLTELIKKCNGPVVKPVKKPVIPVIPVIPEKKTVKTVKPNEKWLPSNFPEGSFDQLEAITHRGETIFLSSKQIAGFGEAIYNSKETNRINNWKVNDNGYTDPFNYPRQSPEMRFYRSINNNYYIEVFLRGRRRWSSKWLIKMHSNNTSYTPI